LPASSRFYHRNSLLRAAKEEQSFSAMQLFRLLHNNAPDIVECVPDFFFYHYLFNVLSFPVLLICRQQRQHDWRSLRSQQRSNCFLIHGLLKLALSLQLSSLRERPLGRLSLKNSRSYMNLELETLEVLTHVSCNKFSYIFTGITFW